MAKDDKRRRRRLRKTKAELVDELEALERRLAEARILDDSYFRAVIRHSPSAIFVRDLEGRYLLVNESYEKLYKVSDAEIFGKTPYDVFDRESAAAIVAGDNQVLKTGERIERESVVTIADGTVRVQWKVVFPFHDSDGKVIGVCGILTDLAEQKRAERAIRVSEERLHAAIDSLQEGFALYDADDRLVTFNEKYRRMHASVEGIKRHGARFEDIVRAHVFHGLVPEAAGREEAFIKERLELHRNPKGPVIRRFTDGSWYLIDEARTPDGGTAISAINITDLKETENALRKSEALFRAVVTHSPTKIHIKDVEGRYTLINKEAEKLFGVTDEEGRGKTSYDLFPKDVADAFMAHDRSVIESGQARENEEDFTLDGGVHTFLTVKFPIYDLDGIAAVGAIGTDITERKRAEETVRRLAAAIEGLSENFALYGPDDRLIICNRNYRELNVPIAHATMPGTSFEEHVRALADAGLVPQARGREEEWVRDRMERHRNPGPPFEVPRQDGRWFLVREQRMADGSTATIATDITERKKAEEALRASEARLANILDNSPTPIYFKDPHGRFLIANKQYERMYRVKFDDIRGKTSQQIFAGTLGDQFFQHDQSVLKSRKVIEREEQIFGRTYLTLKFPIVDQTGELLGLGGVETDVTQIKKAEKDLREAKEHAEFANRAKTEFLANMSHELRTPLNSIIGLSEMLMTETMGPLGSPKYSEYAKDIRNSGDHLLSLISEVLDLSKIEAGELEIFESEIDVTGAVTSCVRMIEGRAPVEAPRVHVKFAEGLPRLMGDERRFKQILLNLLGNSVKFTPPDGSVSVAARVCNAGRFTIEVADTGIGIAPADIPKVLEPFGQVRDVFTRNHEGTGLGLYLAKSFTEMHGGTLDIASRLGKGTTVTLRFPRERTIAPH